MFRTRSCLQIEGKPVREGLQDLEYGKDNYWTGEKMVEHTTRVAIPIFKYAFPDCEALFAFDNASNTLSMVFARRSQPRLSRSLQQL
jgi:hypothetical protein